MLPFRLSALVVVALSIAATGCGSAVEDPDEEEAERARAIDWRCSEYQLREGVEDLPATKDCRCKGIDRGATAGSASLDALDANYVIVEVPSCSASLGCCLAEGHAPLHDCDCNDALDTCQAEAGSRPESERVSQCPPGGGTTEGRCSMSQENCSQNYLLEQDYFGCCAGLTCDAAAAVPICK